MWLRLIRCVAMQGWRWARGVVNMKWRMVFWKATEASLKYPIGYIFDPRVEDSKNIDLYRSYSSLEDIERVAAAYQRSRSDWYPMIIEDDS